MRPFRELGASSNPDEAFAAKLITSQLPGAAPGAKQRVRAALDARPNAIGNRLLSGVVIAGLCAAAISWALWKQRDSVMPPIKSGPLPAAAAPANPSVPSTSSDEVSAEEATTPAVRHALAHPLRHKIVAHASEDSDDRESLLIVEAMERWRGDKDAARATALVELYLSRYPHGALVEEAYSIGIEAASARPERASTLARDYLQRFPIGRFSEQARRALDERQK